MEITPSRIPLRHAPLLPRAGEGGRRPDEGDRRPDPAAAARPEGPHPPLRVDLSRGKAGEVAWCSRRRSSGQTPLLPRAGEGGRRPDEGAAPMRPSPAAARWALTRRCASTSPVVTGEVAWCLRRRSPGQTPLLPRAGEGGRRPDEGDRHATLTPPPGVGPHPPLRVDLSRGDGRGGLVFAASIPWTNSPSPASGRRWPQAG